MKILSVNVGIPKSYTLDDVTLETSMIKLPQTQIHVHKESIEGDVFKGKGLHGTVDAVVYALDSRRYEHWSQLCGRPLPLGTFGENLSVDSLNERDFFLGDEYQCGSVLIRVTGCRYPCNRLNFVSGHKAMRDEFLNDNSPGVYFEVVQPGTIKPHDELILKKRLQSEMTALDLFQSIRSAERKTITEAELTRLNESPFLLQKYKERLYRRAGLTQPTPKGSGIQD